MRNLPNAEEAENVVDAIGGEIGRHLCKTLFPPPIVVTAHRLPVVGGETPVLSVDGKGIGRRTGLAVEVKQVGFCPRLDRTGGDTDGDVALQHYIVLLSIGTDCRELCVQDVLQVEMKVSECGM